MKSRALQIAGLVVIVALAVSYGMAAHRFHLFPYQLVKVVVPEKQTPIPGDLLETPKEYFETDVEKLIQIHQPEDVDRLRQELIALLWGGAGLPSAPPAAVEAGVEDARYDDMASLNRIDRISIDMEFGIESHAYLFIPKTPNNEAVIYHEGHGEGGDFINGKAHIGALLDNGYTVAALSMPFRGRNNQPVVPLARVGNLKLVQHDQLKFLAPASGHPVKFMIEPVVVVLNYLESELGHSSVAMVGISGGGWTTTLAAAIDTGIDRSFPVAGTYPIYLRSNARRDWGDYEQTVPELYTTVNYLELYVLGSHGPGRKQLQMINQFDACCFAGVKWETYKDIVRERVRTLGPGGFDLFLDDTHRGHMISEVAMARILEELRVR